MGNSFFRGSPMSRGMATAPIPRGGPTSTVAGLGTVISDLVGAAMYDPEKDPRIQQAKYYGAKTQSEQFDLAAAKNDAARAEQARALISGVTDAMGLSEIAPKLAAADYGTKSDTRGGGDAAMLLANLMGGTPDQTDAAFRAAGGRPDQTREAFGYSVDTDATTKRRGQNIESGDNRYKVRVESGDRRYDTDVGADTAVTVAGLVQVPGTGADGKPAFTNRAGVAAGTDLRPMVSETDARGVAFAQLPGQTQAQAVGPTKEEAAGSMLAADADALTPEQRAAVYGAEPKIDGRAPMNYVVQGADGSTTAQGRTIDGRTDATTGEPIPQNAQLVKREATGTASDVLTKSQRGNLELEAVGYEDFKGLVGMARTVAQSDPTLFGTTGNIRRLAQGVTEQLANVGLLRAGPDANLDTAYQDAYASMASSNVDMSLFGSYDPSLDDITKLSTLLTYGAASVLAGQDGRSISDKDVQVFRPLAGDPTAWLGTQQSFLGGLDLMERIIDQRAGNRAELRGGGKAGTGAPAIGDVQDGYRFKGGDPADPGSWEQVQ